MYLMHERRCLTGLFSASSVYWCREQVLRSHAWRSGNDDDARLPPPQVECGGPGGQGATLADVHLRELLQRFPMDSVMQGSGRAWQEGPSKSYFNRIES